ARGAPPPRRPACKRRPVPDRAAAADSSPRQRTAAVPRCGYRGRRPPRPTRSAGAPGPEARPPRRAAPPRRVSSGNRQGSREQAVLAVVEPAPGRVEVQAVLALRVEPEIEPEGIHPGR